MIEYKGKNYESWGYIPHTDNLAVMQDEYPTVKNIKNRIKESTNFVVDIGAGEPGWDSQSDIFFQEDPSFGGLLIDCNKDKIPRLENRYKDNPNVKVLEAKITSDTVLDVLEDNNVPEGFYLTLDIDGYDLFILEKVLTKHRPSFIVAEINIKIPPPIRFTVKEDPEHFWSNNAFYGFSIQCLDNIIKKYNYKISMLDYDNVILVPDDNKEVKDIDQHILNAYMDGYVNKELVVNRGGESMERTVKNLYDQNVSTGALPNGEIKSLDEFRNYYFSNISNNPNMNLNLRYEFGLPVLYSNRKTRFPWNGNFEMLQGSSVTIEEKIKFIKDYFSTVDDKQYILEG
tara:strand:- start:11617 stop:12645 length:1029 start_codon:yes stop_codon:yes gene_type:complete